MTIQVRPNDETSDYEISLDGAVVGRAYVELAGDRVIFTHTEVDDEHEGQHLGSQLAQAALDDVRGRGLLVVPRCPFIAAWIDKHPDYADLVA